MYSTDFLNDYPLIEITIEKDNKRTQAKAIIDTGSPYTILPRGALRALSLQETDIAMEIKIHGVIHKKECEVTAPAYLINLIIGDRTLGNLLVVEYNFHPDIGLLGHNILNKFELIVNWKERTIQMK